MDSSPMVLKLLPKTFSYVIDYYRYGPPQPSWSFTLYFKYRLIKDVMDSISNKTIEECQEKSSVINLTDNGILIDELFLPNSLRKQSEVYIDEILKNYNHVLLDDWRSVNIGDGLECEWVYIKEKEGEKENNDKKKKYDKVILYLHGGAYILGSSRGFRSVSFKLAKLSNARIFAINYRLAPQSQFPAALHDAITAYNYLINPPKDADFLPIDPKNIVIMGDSAGGGLTMSTLLAIRDLKLSLPAGVVMWSPWVDLSSSMSSIPRSGESDFIVAKPFHYAISPAWEEYEQKAKKLSEKIKLNVDNKPRFWHKSFDRDGRLQLYASNEGLSIPYVSPIFAESLGGLPPMLVQTGDAEILRDEDIYLAYKAANPGKYHLPHYNAENFENSSYKTPTKVVLEVYEEMPHDFQILSNELSTNIAITRTVKFIEQSISGEEEKGSKFLRVTSKGEIIESLREEHYKILERENIGVVLDSVKTVYCSRPNNDNNNNNKNMLLFAVVLLASIVIYNL